MTTPFPYSDQQSIASSRMIALGCLIRNKVHDHHRLLQHDTQTVFLPSTLTAPRCCPGLLSAAFADALHPAHTDAYATTGLQDKTTPLHAGILQHSYTGDSNSCTCCFAGLLLDADHSHTTCCHPKIPYDFTSCSQIHH